MKINEMKTKYLKWCIDNNKETNEETLMEFFEIFEKKLKSKKVSLQDLISEDPTFGDKYHAVLGILIKEENDEGIIRTFAQGHTSKTHIAKALMVMADQLLLDSKLENIIGNVSSKTLEKVQIMFYAMIQTLYGEKEENEVELESKHIC